MTQKQQTKTTENTEASNVLSVSYTAYAIEGEGENQSARKIGLAMTDGVIIKLYASLPYTVILRKPDQPIEGVSFLVMRVGAAGTEMQIGVAVPHKNKQGHDVFGLPNKVVLKAPKSNK